jgi:hypothetical protein
MGKDHSESAGFAPLPYRIRGTADHTDAGIHQ